MAEAYHRPPGTAGIPAGLFPGPLTLSPPFRVSTLRTRRHAARGGRNEPSRLPRQNPGRPPGWLYEADPALPFGETLPEPFKLPYSKRTLRTWPKLIDHWRTSEEPVKPALPSPETVGNVLFRSLFSGEVGERFRLSLKNAEASGWGLRIQLHFDLNDPGLLPLAAFPWELLRDADRDDFLSRLWRTPLSRFFTVARHPLPPHEGPLRILVVQAAPSDLTAFDLAAGWRSVWKASDSNPGVEVESLAYPTFAGLSRKLSEETWHVLHFMGHGGFWDENREGHLCFADAAGKADRIQGSKLGGALKSALPNLRLVFLSSCVSGVMRQHERRGPLAGVVPALLNAGVPAVVAMQASIDSEAAIALSAAFYSKVAARQPVDVALIAGRQAILHTEPSDWAIPALFTRVPDADILGPAAPNGRQPSRHRARKPTFLRLGIRTFWDTEGRIAWGKEMDEECEDILDLRSYFTGDGYRYIKDPAAWNAEIVPTLRNFLARAVTSRQPLHLNFAAHSSLAITAGYILQAKSGLDITIRQRGLAGIQEWRALVEECPKGAILQREKTLPKAPQDHQDVVLALSVTHPVLDDVEICLSKANINARILPATIAGGPSQTSVRNGIQALRLAEVVAGKLAERTAREKTGTLHIFAAAPNALLFFLGQLLHGSGRIQLYEHDFFSKLPGDYQPSILLP